MTFKSGIRWIVIGVALAIACVLLFRGDEEQGAQESKHSSKIERRDARVERRRMLGRKNEVSQARERIDSGSQKFAVVRTNAKKLTALKIGTDGEADYVDENNRPWPEKDKSIARQIDKALDEDDFDALRDVLADASKCDNAQVRDRAIDALEMFGEAAIPELLPFIADSNEDVAENARSCFQSALSEIENDEEKAAVIELVLKESANADLLEDVADELCSMDDLLALQIITDAIEANPDSAAANAARKVYSDITNEEWAGVDSAESWLQKNYESPKDDDESVDGNGSDENS